MSKAISNQMKSGSSVENHKGLAATLSETQETPAVVPHLVELTLPLHIARHIAAPAAFLGRVLSRQI